MAKTVREGSGLLAVHEVVSFGEQLPLRMCEDVFLLRQFRLWSAGGVAAVRLAKTIEIEKRGQPCRDSGSA